MRTRYAVMILMALGCMIGSTPPASAQSGQPRWKSVVSKGGEFSVEMPVSPVIDRTRTRTSSYGTIKYTIVGCKTLGGVYLVTRLDLPTAIIKSAVLKELREARDDMVQEWNGKIISEKRVRAGTRDGLDFTVRGKPDEDSGICTVRTRMYLDGKMIIALSVYSFENRELPEDAGRFLGSLSIGDEKAKVSGGLEPDPVGKMLPDWGLAIDPDKDCKIMPDGKTSLSFNVPGKWHDLNPHVNKLNSPRVIQTVDGDFTLTVKVTGDFKPGAKSLNPASVPSNGGGIIVWHNSENFIRLERFAILRNGRVGPFITFLERESGYEGALHNENYPGGDCYLRMERKGSRIAGYISTDSLQWKQLKPIDTLWPSKIKVGLSASNCSTDPMSVKFEEFSLVGNVVQGTGKTGKKVTSNR